MLVDARISLFVIYPGPRLEIKSSFLAPTIADTNFNGRDPFGGGDLNFVDFVNETGGSLFCNRNDIDSEIRESQALGSKYYTLTYQPHEVTNDGIFRRIRVTLRNPDLRVVTKTGYFAPENDNAADPRHKAAVALADAVRATIPFTALDLKVLGIVQHPDSGIAELTVQVNSKNLDWHKRDDGGSETSFYLAAASLNANKGVLASRWGKITGVVHTQDPVRLAAADCEFTVPVRIPGKTRSVRMMMETEDAGRMGAVDVSRSAIDAAPAKPLPEPSNARPSEENSAGVPTAR